MATRRTTTYRTEVASSDAVAPSLIADAAELGPDGKMNGRFEVQDNTDQDMEISVDPNFTYGSGLLISKSSVGLNQGGGYSQENNPDPFAWFARHSGVGAGTKTIRVHDSRRPTLVADSIITAVMGLIGRIDALLRRS